MSNNRNSLNVDVVSDIVCPWCYVGKKHLDTAIDSMPEIDFHVRWRPFQLNPQMPKEGMGREEYMEKKFGKGDPTRSFYKDLEVLGAQLGIKFDFPAIGFAPNTLDAHRLIHWASGGNDADSAKKQTALVTRLFEVYFEEGGDLRDSEVLIGAAHNIGMNDELVRELLAGDRDVDAIKEQVAIAGKMGISGVPCFIIENKHAVMGAQKPEALAEAFRTAIDEKTGISTVENDNSGVA
ncbi:MAG: DsbA family oxidoreductase [Rhizobiaceae bacterium]|nr:DsbA family oxidoreductase [Rhizobiaceae bacterium]